MTIVKINVIKNMKLLLKWIDKYLIIFTNLNAQFIYFLIACY